MPSLFALHVAPSVAHLSGQPAHATRRAADADEVTGARSRPSELEPPQLRHVEPWSEDDRAYALSLCRRVNRKEAPRIFRVFRRALVEASAEHHARWAARDQAIGPRWAADPWYFVEPEWMISRGLRADLHALVGVLEHARWLGFRNVGLSADLNTTSIIVPQFEGLMRRAVELELRVATGLDPERLAGHDPGRSWAHELDRPRAIGRLLGLLAHELNLGVLGARTLHVDRWLSTVRTRGASSEAHALLALIKLFVRLVGAREVVIPELTTPTPEIGRFFGDTVQIHGASVPAEGDVAHWWSGMRGLRSTLAERTKQPLIDALQDRPQLLGGGSLYGSLEHPDERYLRPRPGEPSRVRDLLGGDLTRVALSLACLYALPATPAIYAGIELGGRFTFSPPSLSAGDGEPISRALRELNDLRARSPALQRGAYVPLSTSRDEILAWIRQLSGAETVLFVANLSPRSKTVRIDDVELLEALGISARQAPGGFHLLEASPQIRFITRRDRGLTIGLGPSAFAFLELERDQPGI